MNRKELRDQMAMAALIGMGTWVPGPDGYASVEAAIEAKALYAYRQADAMLWARGMIKDAEAERKSDASFE